MWLFLPNGFLSVVAHRETPEVLLCRARVKGDLERLLPPRPVFTTPDADYLYRCFVDRSALAETIAYHANAIDYEKFKPSVVDKRRYRAYLEIWDTMAELQDRLAAKPPPQGTFRRVNGKLVMA